MLATYNNSIVQNYFKLSLTITNETGCFPSCIIFDQLKKITSFCFDYMRMFQKQVAKDIALQLFIYTVFATQSRSTPAKLFFSTKTG